MLGQRLLCAHGIRAQLSVASLQRPWIMPLQIAFPSFPTQLPLRPYDIVTTDPHALNCGVVVLAFFTPDRIRRAFGTSRLSRLRTFLLLDRLDFNF